MPDYDQIAWLPLCAGFTVLGLIGSWLVWRGRGAAAGLRCAAWSLIPLAACLTGAVALVGQVGVAVTSFVVGFALSPVVWAGVMVSGLAVVLFVAAGVARRRGVGGGRRPTAPGAHGKAVPAAADDDDLAEVEALLRRRGIR